MVLGSWSRVPMPSERMVCGVCGWYDRKDLDLPLWQHFGEMMSYCQPFHLVWEVLCWGSLHHFPISHLIQLRSWVWRARQSKGAVQVCVVKM